MPNAGVTVKAYGAIEQDTVTTSETTTTTTFTNLATDGPSVTVHLEVGQSCLFVVEAAAKVSGAGAVGAIYTLEVSGPSSSDLAAIDENGCETGVIDEWVTGSKHTLFTATAAGDHTGKIVYRASGAITASFTERRITAIPQPPP
jgi:hypothetical protein